MYIFLLISIVTCFIFALTSLTGYFITARKYRYLEEIGISMGLTAKRGFLFLLPVLKGSYRGFMVTVGYLPGTATTPSSYTYKLLFSPPLNYTFTFYKKRTADTDFTESGSSFNNIFKISRDKNGIITRFSNDNELTDMILSISVDSNIRTLLFTQKMVFFSAGVKKDQLKEPEYYLDKLTEICSKIKSVSEEA